jgi:hypothetical protein
MYRPIQLPPLELNSQGSTNTEVSGTVITADLQVDLQIGAGDPIYTCRRLRC